MRALVTGASGFIGRRLTAALRNQGVDTQALSRSPATGCISVGSYLDAPTADVLIHLAQSSDRRLVNTAGDAAEREALTLMDALLEKHKGRLVYASSAILYGDASTTPRKHTDHTHVSDTYTRIKAGSEQRVLASRFGVVARLSNVYGPGMSRTNVISAIVSQIPGEGPLRVVDDTPIRDFLWCDDAVSGLVRLALCEESGVFNLGTGLGTSIGDVARVALQTAGEIHRELIAAQSSPGGSCLVLDCSATTKAIGWQFEVGLGAGLTRLLRRSHD